MIPTEAPPTAHNETTPYADTMTTTGDSSSEQPISIMSMLQANPPPDPLPDGWIMHRSRSQTGYAYYFNQFTGECKWDPPYIAPELSQLEGLKETLASLNRSGADHDGFGSNHLLSDATNGHGHKSVKSILKQSTNSTPVVSEEKSGIGSTNSDNPAASTLTSTLTSMSTSMSKTTSPASSSSSSSHKKKSSRSDRERDREHHERSSKRPRSSSSTPEKVRALHILKKHRDSRRPSSWRQTKITISKKQAVEELKELISILQDVAGDPKELRATFEELAKTESDCTSAKRGGDLGFFGRKKMQPNFEKASFVLRVGEMSGVVETSSGVHVILRLA